MLGEGAGWGLEGCISGGKPVWVAVMYWPRACIRGSSDQTGLPSSKEVTSPSRRVFSRVLFGQCRIACAKDSGAESQRGHMSLGS